MIKQKYVILLALVGFIVALDQVTKLYIHTQFRLGESLPVIRDYFHITYVRNPGAAFGILSQSHETFRTLFFLILPPVAMGLILYMLKSVDKDDKIQILCLSAIFGGALGNYIDRLQFGYVIDFLDFHWRHQYAWPAFNVADSAIVIGASTLAGLMIFQIIDEVKKSKLTKPNANKKAN